MREFIVSKQKIVIFLLVLALAFMGIGAGTLAYYHSTTVEKDNTLTVGYVETELQEQFEQVNDNTVKKNPSVKNTGVNDCFIRMRVTISPEGAATLTGLDTHKWIYNEKDGFYYYQEKVLPGASSTPLFTSAVIAEDISGEIEIACYQEAVQAQATIEGVTVNDAASNGMMQIWNAYDNRKNVFATRTQ